VTVLAVWTVVLAIVVVRDIVSEESFCRGWGGACLTFRGAETREEVVPWSFWKKDDMLARQEGRESGEDGEREGERKVEGETAPSSSIVLSVRKRRRKIAGISKSSTLCTLT